MRAVCRIRKEPFYRRDAFEKGLQRVGFKLVESLAPQGPEDWLVIWNRKAGSDESMADDWERRGGTVIVVENGYLQKTDKTTYAISVHAHNGAGWFPVGPEDRFTSLGFPVRNLHPVGSEIVLRTQRGIGSKLMASPASWPRETTAVLQQRSPLPVRIVVHPGNFPPKVPIEKDLSNAAFFVTWCSAMGVRAMVNGIPCFYGAPHWVVEGGAEKLARFPKHEVTDTMRLLALHRMSHGQWHFDEIATGEPFARIIANREKASW